MQFADIWLFRGLVTIVALAPLPFGSNRPLPAAILALSTGLLLCLWGVLIAFVPLRVEINLRRVRWPFGLYALVCLWIFIEWVPGIPASLGDPIWTSAVRIDGWIPTNRISVNPEATLTGLMHLLTYAGVFWLSAQLAREPQRARIAVRIIALIGGAYALYGIIVFLSGNGTILIYRKWAYLDSLTGTFVNRNSFATFMGLSLLCAVTMLLDRLRYVLALRRPLRVKAAMLIEELIARSAWMTATALSISIALVLSASRGGVLSSTIGLWCLLTFYFVSGKINKTLLLLISATLFAIVGAAYVTSGGHLTDRLGIGDVGDSLEGRGDVYALTADAIATSPWTGTGFGTFPDVFPAFRGAGHPDVLWDKAHNTYLENALELGIPAAFFLNLSVLLLALRAARGVAKRRRDKDLPAIGVAATIIVGLHSLVDFSLQIPAVSILYAFMLGISVSQSWSTSSRRVMDSTADATSAGLQH